MGLPSSRRSRAGEGESRVPTAAILAGGLGNRLRSVVADRPKPLADVGGRPFLRYLLEQLADAGIGCVVICTGYLGHQVPAVFGREFLGMRLRYSQEPGPLGTAGALRHALPLLDSGTVLVLNGDSYCTVDLRKFRQWHALHPWGASLVLSRAAEAGRFGRVAVEADGRVVRFEEKGADPGPGWVNAGIYLAPTALIAALPVGAAASLEREVFPGWSREGRLYGWTAAGELLDIGTPESFVGAGTWLAERT